MSKEKSRCLAAEECDACPVAVFADVVKFRAIFMSPS